MPALLLLSGPSSGLHFEVRTEATIGRSPSCEIPVPGDDQLSRRHARFVVREGELILTDLGSRNGTAVNGEPLQGEAVLRSGDRVQVGRTTLLVGPPGAAVMVEATQTNVRHLPIEEVLPHVGAEAAMYSAGSALLGATSEAMVLRRLAQETLHALHAETAAALLGTVRGLLTAAVVGAPAVRVPRDLAHAALERSEQGRTERALCTPLVASGGPAFGVLYVERSEPPFSEEEGRLVAMLGRLGGEAYAAVRSREDPRATRVEMVGRSRPFQRLVELARRASTSAEPVLLQGEPGCGKSLCAQYIHSRSPRALGPLVRVDCREGARLEEELFGHSGGPGQPPLPSGLLLADGGTLLLQHVELLPVPVAERLAGLFARKMAPGRLGGEEPVDVRLITTASVAAKAPRLEVLQGLALEVPPLRERRADIPALFELFATRGARDAQGVPPVLTPEARQLLVDYAWPHNIRELELLGERLARVRAGGRLSPLDLPPELQSGGASPTPLTLPERIARLEREAIADALRAAGGKKSIAARSLGISRPTLDKKIEEYQLTVARRRA